MLSLARPIAVKLRIRRAFSPDPQLLPSCHAKRLEEWGEWILEELLLDVPHRQAVFVIPKMLRIFQEILMAAGADCF